MNRALPWAIFAALALVPLLSALGVIPGGYLPLLLSLIHI